MTTYAERIAAQQGRNERRAAAARRRAESLLGQATEMADVIPFGQPILVGHHSEGRDRRYRARIDAKFRAGFEASREAEALEGRSTSTGILSTDDDAAELLRTKIADLEEQQERMKLVNRIVRKHRANGADAVVAALIEAGVPEGTARKAVEPRWNGDPNPPKNWGIPGYALSNNNANIRRYRERLAEIEAAAAAPPVEGGEIGDGISWGVDADEGRVWIEFPGKPERATITLLKQAGLRWAPSLGRWQRQSTANGIAAVQRLIEGGLA